MTKITFLGTGTSHGVPMIGCECATCISTDSKDKRTNSALLIEKDGVNILLDCGRDFRLQALREKITHIDYVLLTHNHFDHVAGIDDLRVYNRIQNQTIPIYGKPDHLEYLQKYIYHYLFGDAIQQGGGLSDIEMIPVIDKFELGGIVFEPLNIMHGKLHIYGYKFLNCAYLSDVSFIPEDTKTNLHGLDVLIIDALRFRKHSTHFNIEEALSVVDELKPKKIYFTHIAHDIKHNETSYMLKDIESEIYSEHDVEIACDSLAFHI